MTRNTLRNGHLQDQWPSPGRQGQCTDSTHTIFIHPSLRIQHTFNLFHVYTYISHWGSERQSPSLEIIFDLVLTHTGVCPLSGWNPCPYDEGGGNQWANAVCCKQDNQVRAAPKSQLQMYIARPCQMS